MFEKEAEKCASKLCCTDCKAVICTEKCECWVFAKKGAELGYNQGKAEANEWHRVSDKLPVMDVFVYLWKKGDDYPVVACRHIFHGHKEWVWYCMWGSSYTMSQLKGKDYLWKEMILPKVAVKFDVPHSKAEQELNLENNLTDLGIM